MTKTFQPIKISRSAEVIGDFQHSLLAFCRFFTLSPLASLMSSSLINDSAFFSLIAFLSSSVESYSAVFFVFAFLVFPSEGRDSTSISLIAFLEPSASSHDTASQDISAPLLSVTFVWYHHH